MNRIALLWDASHLWGLLAWQAFKAFDVPCELVKGLKIAHHGLSDKTLLLVVPGGTARHKFEALGPQGREALRQWVGRGGHYLGFCGGAGLGLSDPQSGLCLCPWKRARFSHRLQHFLSGHVVVRPTGLGIAGATARMMTEDVSSAFTEPGVASQSLLTVPVWWPGRFDEPSGPDNAARPANFTSADCSANANCSTGADCSTGANCSTDANCFAGADPVVLARYAGPGPDLHVADIALSGLPASVLEEWRTVYGLSLEPAVLRGEPCVIGGSYGKGGYTLSYSHLETPDSPHANAWLAQIVEASTGQKPALSVLPSWPSAGMPSLVIPPLGAAPGELATALPAWHDARLLACCEGMRQLMALGHSHGLFFPRTPWLTGWRPDVPGAGLNNVDLALRVLVSHAPTPEAEALWKNWGPEFCTVFDRFRQGAEGNLLARRLAATVPEAVPRAVLAEQRTALFGSAMQGGGLYQRVMNMLDELLFVNLQGR